eukprot:712064-Pleurochrysis_carterae.AAC.3
MLAHESECAGVTVEKVDESVSRYHCNSTIESLAFQKASESALVERASIAALMSTCAPRTTSLCSARSRRVKGAGDHAAFLTAKRSSAKSVSASRGHSSTPLCGPIRSMRCGRRRAASLRPLLQLAPPPFAPGDA